MEAQDISDRGEMSDTTFSSSDNRIAATAVPRRLYIRHTTFIKDCEVGDCRRSRIEHAGLGHSEYVHEGARRTVREESA